MSHHRRAITLLAGILNRRRVIQLVSGSALTGLVVEPAMRSGAAKRKKRKRCRYGKRRCGKRCVRGNCCNSGDCHSFPSIPEVCLSNRCCIEAGELCPATCATFTACDACCGGFCDLGGLCCHASRVPCGTSSECCGHLVCAPREGLSGTRCCATLSCLIDEDCCLSARCMAGLCQLP